MQLLNVTYIPKLIWSSASIEYTCKKYWQNKFWYSDLTFNFKLLIHRKCMYWWCKNCLHVTTKHYQALDQIPNNFLLQKTIVIELSLYVKYCKISNIGNQEVAVQLMLICLYVQTEIIKRKTKYKTSPFNRWRKLFHCTMSDAKWRTNGNQEVVAFRSKVNYCRLYLRDQYQPHFKCNVNDIFFLNIYRIHLTLTYPYTVRRFTKLWW